MFNRQLMPISQNRSNHVSRQDDKTNTYFIVSLSNRTTKVFTTLFTHVTRNTSW